MRRYRQIVHANAYARTSASSGPPPPPPPSGTPITLSFLGGTSNIYVVQYSSIGNPVWATNLGYTSGTVFFNSITTDSSSNVYAAGYYTSNLVAYNSNGTPFATTLTNPNTWATSFLVKYDSNRNVQFFFNSLTKVQSTAIALTLNSMAVDTNGNVNGTGTYAGTTTYYSQNGATSSWTTIGGIDWHTVQYSPAGNLNWKARAGGGLTDYGVGLVVDSSNNVIAVGYSPQITFFDALGVSYVSFASTPSNMAYVVQYSSTGSLNWAARMGTGGVTSSPSSATGVCVDSSNNITVVGTFTYDSVSNFVASNGSTPSVSGTAFGTTLIAPSSSSFIVRYSSAGSVNWLTYISGLSSPRIARDSSNNIYVVGVSTVSVTFYNAGSTSSVATYSFSGTSNVVLTKYTSSGAFQWYCVLTSNANTPAVVVDSSNNITVSGLFTDTLTAYTSNASAYSNTLTDTVGNSRFLVQFSSGGSVNWVAQSTGAVNILGTFTGSESIDSGNNILVAGNYQTSNITFNPHA